jgi:hypothetical protein
MNAAIRACVSGPDPDEGPAASVPQAMNSIDGKFKQRRRGAANSPARNPNDIPIYRDIHECNDIHGYIERRAHA